jgi:hypothetical protein
MSLDAGTSVAQPEISRPSSRLSLGNPRDAGPLVHLRHSLTRPTDALMASIGVLHEHHRL